MSKLDNQTDRNSLSGRNQRPPVVLPPRRNIMQQVPKNFAPHLAYSPQHPQRHQFTPRFIQRQHMDFNQGNYQQRSYVLPQRPPKPAPRPQPMEIDESLRTKT
ncbi:hypothetical protein EVAR_68050_1 [Eumeta japonica]|uniref:Uncharacterized protein n=1 Tax=Eumeta variegata TaxID=151549 RepID=A0A4C1T7W0_EUMVA|nr:hypothetical protein EVAR_68050_1 [Eumeta japonica]